MENIIFNRGIAESIFNDRDLRNELADALNSLMDAELEKEDCDIDFELLDAYAEALNELYGEDNIVGVVWRLQTSEEFLTAVRNDRKHKIINRSLKALLAACAVLALLFAANTVTERATGVDNIGKVANAVKKILTGEMKEPETSSTQTDALPTDEEAPAFDVTAALDEAWSTDASGKPAGGLTDSGEQEGYTGS